LFSARFAVVFCQKTTAVMDKIAEDDEEVAEEGEEG